jgi:hypothetical protein
MEELYNLLKERQRIREEKHLPLEIITLPKLISIIGQMVPKVEQGELLPNRSEQYKHS